MTTTLETNSFQLGTTYVIGSYILPGELNENINKANNAIVNVRISNCIDVVAKIKSGKLNLGMIETPTFDDDVIAEEWIEDEMIICSNVELPPFLDKEELSKYKIICQKDTSPIHKLIKSFFKEFNIFYQDFYSISKAGNTTASIQGVRWSRPNREHPTITIVSSRAIEDEVKSKRLFISRIKGLDMHHKFYIVYRKDIEMKRVQNIINELKRYPTS
jgi:DNA-binding transcriptional LysR family regulator